MPNIFVPLVNNCNDLVYEYLVILMTYHMNIIKHELINFYLKKKPQFLLTKNLYYLIEKQSFYKHLKNNIFHTQNS